MLDPTGIAIAAVAMALANLVKAVTGFGSALIAMPVLLLLLEPGEAILVMLATDLFSSAWLLKDVWRSVRWPLVLTIVAGAIPGQWFGTELLTALDPIWVRRILGVIVVLLGARFVIRPVIPGQGELEDLPDHPQRLLALAAVAGAAGGAMHGLVGAAGPPIIAFCKRFFADAFFRAQLVAVFQLTALSLAIQLLSKGAADFETLMNVPWLLVPVAIGKISGSWLAPRASRATFARVTGVVLFGAGVALLV